MPGGGELSRSIAEGLPFGVAVLDGPDELLWSNPAFRQELAAAGRTFTELLTDLGSTGPRVRAAIERAIAARSDADFLTVPAERGGGTATYAHYDLHIRPLSAGPAGPHRALVVLANASDRVHAHERTRLFYESYLTSTNAIEVTDREGLIVDVNPAFERIYGYSRQELLGRSPKIVRSRHTPRSLYTRMWADLLDPALGHWSGELLNRDRFGKERPVFLTITAIRNDVGETTHYLGVAVDLTELKAWQRSASHADKLASVGQLAAGVAHEINTPLANVMLVAESLSRRSKDPWVQSRAETITDQVQVAARIVRGLLDFARRNDPQTAPLDLAALTRETVEFLRGKQSANVEIVEIYPGAPPMVLGDKHQLGQVLTNVLNNAYEAMEGNGRLRVEVRADDRNVEVEVSDNGPGIPEEALGHIFEPFFTTKPEGQGTGLGLAICHGIVQAHHGTIVARNGPNGGASFVISLPRDVPAAPRPERTPANGTPA